MIATLFQYDFIRNTFIVGLVIGIVAPLLGSFIVVRKLSLMADALSHVTLAGIAVSLFLSKTYVPLVALNPLYLGFGFATAGSLLMEKLRSVYKHFEELAIPIIMSAGMGFSVIFISLANGFNTDLFSYLFGSVSAVSRNDMYTIVAIATFVFIIILLLYKELFLLSFDEEYAKVSGIRAKAFDIIFMVLVALVIASSMRIVGILLVSSLMTLPVAAAIRIAKGFKQTIIIAIIFGEISVIVGLVSAYYLDLAPGGAIVLLSVIILILTMLYQKIRLRVILSKRGEENGIISE
ncbi:metal ABC transporter permease [Listeria fleischmannii]|uniref:Zinc ABC transporter permease n=2 Tax=Listeria fleischmannii TaxID=1069827 RepID=W7DIH2_9LIST|nr:metal ABC transporter permease [Listeria fleischmannii]EIA20288.1 zinc ABC transporter, permease protein [Listeria fleischmannii subsp. coloradonensis]EUJ64443.1 zinc ABC transporter permease [Listeria fleischmannii FSL S10-1203]MBC1399845.1 metal ABC transporter permease [Listeria fleischmannii]MBC1428154.1 metal ABC transporter permease [Listeria fleischmannii]STY34959.1 High-affinity zinc uptake system membrane protein znuB [Listeria fleischmannii subsp. coloradonensis]